MVGRVTEPRVGLTAAQVRAGISQGSIVVPCGVDKVTVGGQSATPPAGTTCRQANTIPAAVAARTLTRALIPAGLVTPIVKVLQVDGADLFGGPKTRTKDYSVKGSVKDWPAAWTAYDVADVRTLVSVGDTCPDRGVSKQTNTLGKGWDWALNGGTARYIRIGRDHRYSGFDGTGWPVVIAQRVGDAGKVKALISNAEVTADDFECPMVKAFIQHNTGTIFSIDPKVAPFLKRNGIDVVTLGSNHITDRGQSGVLETISYLNKAGVKHTGAGKDLDAALAPAVFNLRGLKIAFVGWDDIAGSGTAAPGKPGVAVLTTANVQASIQRARQAADIVVAMPQWGWPEYHARFTAEQRTQMKLFYDSGADIVLGSGTHWAAAVSITKGGGTGYRFAISSHGNFLFGQDWSRQTQEGVIVELTFLGKRLVQARLHPYIMLDEAQANLVDPATDGRYVLNQVWSVSDLAKK